MIRLSSLRSRTFAGALFLSGTLGGAASAAEQKAWKDWLAELRAEAKQRGHQSVALGALEGIEPIERVLELDKKQPEFTMTFDEYVTRIVTPERIEEGRRQLELHREIIERASKKYGVQPEYLVAFWGMETRYGKIMGDYSIVNALATLAHQSRRAGFFRKELFAALKILDQGHVAPDAFKGSWAGAMGHCQFMPTTFLAYSADGNGDGKNDIWGTHADVFASAARYLSKLRWNPKEKWGVEVKLPEKFNAANLGLKTRKPSAQWAALGVRTVDGKPLPKELPIGSLVKPGNTTERAFLVFGNFRATLGWNRSQYFAAGVGMVADGVAAGEAAAPPVVRTGAP